MTSPKANLAQLLDGLLSSRISQALGRCCQMSLIAGLGVLLGTEPAHAFWVVNFGPAMPSKPGSTSFVGGMGGQVVFVGEPTTSSATFFIPHAGIRYGLADWVDVGYRLAPMPLPFSSVGPGLGGNVDFKFGLSPRDWPVQVGLDLGAGLGYARVSNVDKVAYSPNGALLLTSHLSDTLSLTGMGRYAHIAFPTASGGAAGNFVNISGASIGLKWQFNPRVALLPEVGAYWYDGQMNGVRASGPAFQYGVVLGTSY
jgi:hypothetical protein